MDFVLDPPRYDVIVVGTSITETLVAAAVANAGKKVLQIDRNDYYSGNWASFSLQEFENWAHRDRSPVKMRAEDDKWNEIVLGALASTEPHSDKQCTNNQALNLQEHPASQFLGFSSSHDCYSSVTTFSARKIISHHQQTTNKQLSLSNACQGIWTKSRQFILDICPHWVFSNASFVELLVKTNVGQYVQFRPFETTFIYLGDDLRKVPSSRSDVFQDKYLQVSEKRALMRLLQSTMKPVSEDDTQPESLFVDFLSAKKVPDHLRSFIFYSIALLNSEDEALTISKEEALMKMNLFLGSLGRFSRGPSLFPLYGIGEVVQGFTRLCSVYGGDLILKFPPQCAVSSNGVYRGIVTHPGQLVSSDFLVTNLDYFPQFEDIHSNRYISRGVCILTHPIRPTASSDVITFFTIPPGSISNLYAVHIMQTDSTVAVCPDGYCVLFMSCLSEGPQSSPLAELLPVLQRFASTQYLTIDDNTCCEAPLSPHDPTQPVALWATFYHERQRHCSSEMAIELPKNILMLDDPTDIVSCDGASQQAKSVFHRMYPNEEYFPTAAIENRAEKEAAAVIDMIVETPIDPVDRKLADDEDDKSQLIAEDDI